MTPELWQRVKQVLAAALERPAAGREAFLDEACAEDPALRKEVESLLAADAASGVLDTSAPTLADDESAAPTRVTIGSRLGPYEIVSFLGAGAMGEVYRARDTRLGREVAVKALHASAGGDAERRFDDEARAASALNHPNILTVYDVGSDAGSRYVVSELLEGTTLRARLAEGPLAQEDCLRLGRQIAAGLAAAHDQGIVHRDLKPENLFLTRDGRVKILDFGLAKRLWGEDLRAGSRRTLPGTILGTIGYMSPEQVRGQPADARSDLFALGALLYEMLGGRRAFSGGSAVETMTAILVDEPPAFASPVAPALEQLILQCLRKQPADRVQSAQEVEARLAAVQASPAADAGAPLVRPAPGQARHALAVLPLLNMTGEAGLDYVCEGIAEELINALTRVEGLRVAARSSSFRARADSIARIGALLGVDKVLEGSVRRMAQRLRVTARLVNVADGYPVWSERFELPVEDLVEVQDAVVARVVEALRLGLDPSREPASRSADPLAYRLYLKGLHFWSKRHQGGLETALEAFRQSTERDPLYAPAWAGLADSYALLGHSPYDVLPAHDALPKAKAAALKALALEPTLATPHANLGWIHLHYDWDWPAAQAAFERALVLDPRRAATYHWYAFYLSAMGRTPEAVQASQRAWELDPLSLIGNAQLCQPHYYARRFDEVAAAAQHVLAMDPSFAVGDHWLGNARSAQGRYAEAIEAFERLARHGGGRSTALALIGNARARAGERDAAEEALRELDQLAAQKHVPAIHRALIHIGLGDADRAFEWLERACDDRSDMLAYVGVEPLFDPLRADPRFAALLGRIGSAALAPRAPVEVASPRPAPLSVAVLPFRELFADVESGHLGIGLADATIAELARLRSLMVRPTSTILRYRDSPADALQAGRELGVDVVVDAGFERRAARLAVSVRILDTRDGGVLWTGSLEGTLDDVFALQDEVARQVARALEPDLTPSQEGRIAERRPGPRAEAYEAYVRGKACMFGESLPEVIRAVDWYERARERDPEFALAWTGLADAYARLAFTYQPEGDWHARAQATCERALALDPSLPEARYVRARLRWTPQSGFDHEGAVRDLVPVLEARPSLEDAYVLLGNVLHHVGLFDEARELYERAEALRPGHPRARTHVVMCLGAQGRHEEALAYATRTPPTEYTFHDYLVALTQIHLGQLEAAERTVGRMEGRVPEEILAYPLRGLLAALRGDRAEADRHIQLTQENRKAYGHYHHAQYDVACIHALLGRHEDALAWLREAASDGYPCLPHFQADAFLASLREDPGFKELVGELREREAALARLYAQLRGRGVSRVVLAVLPLEDLAGDPDQEYFGDGLTDELITQLGRLDPERLAVIGRGSAMRYKGAARDLRAAARELRADYLLEGSVRRSETRVRVSARLLRGSDQTQVWARAYERDLTDVLEVQAELGRAVAGEIGLRLASPERAPARKADPAAYQAYLRGRYCWSKRTVDGVQRAIANFEEALRLDPRLAAAHAGIADCHALLGDLGSEAVAPREAFARAEEATARALALDDKLPQAHVSLAHVRMHRFDWAGARRAFEHALQLDPNNPTAHHWHALCLAALGRDEQALAAIRRALALDPVSLAINTDFGVVHYYARRYDAAIEQYRRTLELDPGFTRAWLTLGSACSLAGRHEEALAALESVLGGAPPASRRASLARCLARAGRKQEARALLGELLALPEGRRLRAYPSAMVHAALGELEPAFEKLAAAERESASELVYLGVDPWLEPLRGDSRFDALMRRVGLEDAPVR